MVGNCGIFPGRTGPAEPEIGYMIRWSDRGRGFAGETVGAVLEECGRAGLGRVWTTVRAGNTASRRIMQRYGFRVLRAEEDLLFHAADLRGEQLLARTGASM
ncbi:GNAT family N-acetyltransferase [Actinoplanes sp. NPDC023801]|uniref:GNAT family N-acetyltransferase n=1 Tax=Actinoplanes sp. NPDC023801 TaxID=3154595 RepID=UPI00341082BC